MEHKKVFLSYCSADAVIADALENTMKVKLGPQVTISKYTRDVGYRDSFREFMNTISTHDFVLTIVSDKYLKSPACLYEVGEVIKDHNFKKRILFVVISEKDQRYYGDNSYTASANIYTIEGRLNYLLYWQEAYEKLYRRIESIKSLEAKIPYLEDLKRIRKIIDYDINPFLEYLADAKGISYSQLEEHNYEEMLDAIIPFRTRLTMHDGFHYKQESDGKGGVYIINNGSVDIEIGYTSYLSTFESSSAVVASPGKQIGFLSSEDITYISPFKG